MKMPISTPKTARNSDCGKKAPARDAPAARPRAGRREQQREHDRPSRSPREREQPEQLREDDERRPVRRLGQRDGGDQTGADQDAVQQPPRRHGARRVVLDPQRHAPPDDRPRQRHGDDQGRRPDPVGDRAVLQRDEHAGEQRGQGHQQVPEPEAGQRRAGPRTRVAGSLSWVTGTVCAGSSRRGRPTDGNRRRPFDGHPYAPGPCPPLPRRGPARRPEPAPVARGAHEAGPVERADAVPRAGADPVDRRRTSSTSATSRTSSCSGRSSASGSASCARAAATAPPLLLPDRARPCWSSGREVSR